MYRERTKNIDVRYHFLREISSQGNIIVKKIDTSNNATDMITKPIPNSKFQHCLLVFVSFEENFLVLNSCQGGELLFVT